MDVPEPLLVKSYVYRCYGCKRWLCRLPQWAGDDGIGGCEHCGCTSSTFTEGRPYGPRSVIWPHLMHDWRESIQPLLETVVMEKP